MELELIIFIPIFLETWNALYFIFLLVLIVTLWKGKVLYEQITSRPLKSFVKPCSMFLPINFIFSNHIFFKNNFLVSTMNRQNYINYLWVFLNNWLALTSKINYLYMILLKYNALFINLIWWSHISHITFYNNRCLFNLSFLKFKCTIQLNVQIKIRSYLILVILGTTSIIFWCL